MKLPSITNAEQLNDLVEELGFLPFFINEIPGFSVEECCPREYWFTDIPGPWEWKSDIAEKKHTAYGKFFGKSRLHRPQIYPPFLQLPSGRLRLRRPLR